MKSIHLVFFLSLISFNVFSQSKIFEVPKFCKLIIVSTDSLSEVKLKEALMQSGFTTEIDKDGFWKTTNSVSCGANPVFLNGRIYKKENKTLIQFMGQMDDSYQSNATNQIIGGAFTPSAKTTSQIVCRGMKGSVYYTTFGLMLKIALRIGNVEFEPIGEDKIIYEEEYFNKLP
jgi:hypothetical protein